MEFREAYNRVSNHIETKYRLEVRIADVVDPNTGDFDGMEILIDYDQDPEIALFVLAHLFGHTVQWNLSEEFRRIGQETPDKSAEEIALVEIYERDATRYSLAIMHEAGVTHLDQWVTDWWRADWQFLTHFYASGGERLDVRTLFVAGTTPVLTPLAVPAFTPQRWVSRFAF